MDGSCHKCYLDNANASSRRPARSTAERIWRGNNSIINMGASAHKYSGLISPISGEDYYVKPFLPMNFRIVITERICNSLLPQHSCTHIGIGVVLKVFCNLLPVSTIVVDSIETVLPNIGLQPAGTVRHVHRGCDRQTNKVLLMHSNM